MIRVLMAVPDLGISNGVSAFAMAYYNSLKRTMPGEVHMDFAVINHVPISYESELQKNGSVIFHIPDITEPIFRIPDPTDSRFVRECREFLQDHHYDIVHDCTLVRSIPLMKAARLEGIPVRILHSHNTRLSDSRIKQIGEALLLPFLKKEVNTYFACSKDAAKAMFGNEPYTFLPNVIPLKKYQFSEEIREKVRKENGIDLSERVILMVGRIARQKNPLFAVRLMPDILRKIPTAKLIFIGNTEADPKLTDRVKKEIDRLHLKSKVQLLGSRSDVSDWYSAADLLIAPSTFEGLLIVGVEAQAAGLPCIVSQAVPEEMRFVNRVTYLPLAHDEWVEEIARQMIRYGRPEIGLQNCPYSDENAGRNLVAIYKKLLQK